MQSGHFGPWSAKGLVWARAACPVVCAAVLLVCGSVSDASGAVTVQGAAKTSASAATTATIASFDPGGASNRVLVVGLTFGQGAPANVNVTYAGFDLVLAPGTAVTRGNAHTEIWYLTEPPIGTSSIVATWTGNHDVVMGAVSFNGADQTTPVVNGTSANGASAAPSLTIASAAGDMTMDAVSTLAATLSAPTRTQQWLDTTPATVRGGGSTAAGAATVTHAWTAASALNWTSSGVSIKAAVIGFEVGSFTKTTSAAPTAQVIPHGLGQAPKAIILWTEGRPDTTFSGTTPIAFRAAASATAASGVLTLTINKPAGTVINDVMVASIGVAQAAGATITAPAGWALAPAGRVSNGTATANALAVYYKVAGAAEPANYAFTFSASTGAVGGIQSFSGVDITAPVDIDAVQTHASSLNSVAPTVTTTSTNEMIVRSHTFSSSATWIDHGRNDRNRDG